MNTYSDEYYRVFAPAHNLHFLFTTPKYEPLELVSTIIGAVTALIQLSGLQHVLPIKKLLLSFDSQPVINVFQSNRFNEHRHHAVDDWYFQRNNLQFINARRNVSTYCDTCNVHIFSGFSNYRENNPEIKYFIVAT